MKNTITYLIYKNLEYDTFIMDWNKKQEVLYKKIIDSYKT